MSKHVKPVAGGPHALFKRIAGHESDMLDIIARTKFRNESKTEFSNISY